MQWTRRLLWGIGAILLVVAVTVASVALAAPDVFDGACDRTQLVVAEICPGAPGLRTD